MSYLVDTSVWIDFLRGKKTPSVQFLETLLEEGEAGICEVVLSELCWGAKDSAQFERYQEYFGELPSFPLPASWSSEAARKGYELRKKGFKPFLADLLIALCALTHKVPLLTTDGDFKPYSSLFGLQIEGI